MILKFLLAILDQTGAPAPAPGPSGGPFDYSSELYLSGVLKLRLKWSNGDASAYTEIYRWSSVSQVYGTPFPPGDTNSSPRWSDPGPPPGGDILYDMPTAPTLVATALPGATSFDTDLTFQISGTRNDTFFLVHLKNGQRSNAWLPAPFSVDSFPGLVIVGLNA